MPRNTGTGRYWENEKPAEIAINGSFLLKYYPKAGMLQHFNMFDRGEMTGKLSKGVTVDLGKLNSEQLNEFEKSISAIVAMERKTRSALGAVAATPAPARPPVRTLAEAARDIGVSVD